MKTMRFPWGVEGYLKPAEGKALWECASAVDPGSCVVELGAYKGRSTICLAQSGRVVVSVDHFAGEPKLPKVPGVYPDHRDGFYLRQYEKNLEDRIGAEWRATVFPYTGSSDDAQLAAAIAKAHGPIGMVFIDADHSFDAVHRDFATWEPLLAAGGIMAFHDQQWRGPAAVIEKALSSGEWVSRRLVHDLRVLQRVSKAAVDEREQSKVGVS